MSEITRILIAHTPECTALGITAFFAAAENIEVAAIAERGVDVAALAAATQANAIITGADKPFGASITLVAGIICQCPQLPVIVFTHALEVGLIRRMLQEGVKGYVAAASDMEELGYAIQSAAMGEVYTCPVTTRVLKAHTVSFSEHQHHIISLMKEGKTDEEIGEELCKSPRSIEDQRRTIKKKLNVTSNAAAVHAAFARGYCL